MPEDDEDETPPLLACGHAWDGAEDWSDMAVVRKEVLDGPDGPQPAISTGHHCRACREKITGQQFASLAEAEAWLREELAKRTKVPSPETLLRDLPPDWWLDVECPCNSRGAVSLRITRLMARVGPDARLGDVAARLKCLACKKPAEKVTLVDSPATPEGGGWAPAATVQIRVVEWRGSLGTVEPSVDRHPS